MKINAEWHKENRMPKNSSLAERVKWYLEHAKKWACQPMPLSIQKEIQK